MRKGFRKGRQRMPREFDTKVVEIKRVVRVVAGGKRMRFRALVVVGNKKGKIGIGLKKGSDVADAVAKASEEGKKDMITVDITESGSIPYGVRIKYKAAKIILKPAPSGTGIIAGGPVRAVLDMVGIQNISSKMLGSANKVSNVRATFEALKNFKKKDDAKKEEKPASLSQGGPASPKPASPAKRGEREQGGPASPKPDSPSASARPSRDGNQGGPVSPKSASPAKQDEREQGGLEEKKAKKESRPVPGK